MAEEKEITIKGRKFKSDRLFPNYRGEFDQTCEECALGSHCPQTDPWGNYTHCKEVKCITQNRDENNRNVWTKVPLTDEELSRELTEEEVHLMMHSLGLDDYEPEEDEDDGTMHPYRNRYAAEQHSDKHYGWDYLSERGLAGPPIFDGQYVWYKVTEEGVHYLESILGKEIRTDDQE